MKKLTILTRPTNVPPVVKHKYGGHQGVTRSLVEGLQKIGYEDFNYGPDREDEIAEHVHVLAGVNTLQYAIELKKKKKIKTITAGPNVVVYPYEYNALITNPTIEKYLSPSDWNKRQFIEMEPSLEGRIYSWPAGVDTEYFKPDEKIERNNTVIVYHKYESNQFCYRVCFELRKYGYQPIVFKYGYKLNGISQQMEGYDLGEFKEALKRSCFAIFISDFESQGIALAEMWAMDVPTICFDPHYFMSEWEGRFIERDGDISSCPYLSEATGLRFSNFEELSHILGMLSADKMQFSPRDWVLGNMSDEVCARKFLELIGIAKGKSI